MFSSGDCSEPVRFWHWAVPEEESEMSREEAVSGIQERLLQAVKLRLRSDVPMAFCMSGGVDSNAIISIARKEFDCDVQGFTISNQDERYDESRIIDSAVKQLGIRHTSVKYENQIVH